MTDEPRDDVPMTIGEHLDELRRHVLKAVLWVVLSMVVCLVFQDTLMWVATRPHKQMVEAIRRDHETRRAATELDQARVDAALEATDRDDALGKRLQDLERARLIARERARPTSSETIAALEARQVAVITRVEQLTAELEAAGRATPPDPARLEVLEREVAAARQEAEVVRAEVARDVRPLLEDPTGAPKAELVSLAPTDVFLTYIKLAMVAALFVAAPLIIFELWKFISRALYPHEKKWVRLFGPLTYVAFFCGFLFGYLVLIPLGLQFLGAYAPVDVAVTQYSVQGYMSMLITLSLVCGVIFELPLFMCFLSLIGIVDAPTLRSWRRYWVLAAFIVGGILTPPDPFTQSLMAIPLLGLYEVGILLSALVSKPAPPPEPPAEPAVEPAIEPAPEPSLEERYPETPLDPPPPADAPAEPDLLGPRPAPEGTVAHGPSDPPPPTPPAPDLPRPEGEPTA